MAGVNVAWAIEFWSSGDHALIYQIFAIAMIVIELTGLVIIGHLNVAGKRREARVWLFVFGAALLLNVITDFAAIMTRSAGEVEAAARDRAAYDQALVREGELQSQIAAPSLLLQQRGEARPVDAAAAQLAALQAQRDLHQRRNHAIPRRLADRLAEAEADLAVARALSDARAELGRQRAIIARYGQRPELAPHLQGAANLLGSFGATTSPEEVQAWFSLLIAAIVKFAVVVGPWAILPLLRPIGLNEIPTRVAEARTPEIEQPQPAPRRITLSVAQALDDFERLS